MSDLARVHHSRLARGLAAGAAAALVLTTAGVGTAAAHGSVVEPPSRNYGCWERWGHRFQAPSMATEDPMCDQAWRADPNAMWNWNGLYKDNVGGNHQAAVPDGRLCSGGRTEGGRYAALETPGPWVAERVGRNFTVTVHDQAQHGADYYRVYVTRQGFNFLTDRLRWSDLELVKQTGRIAPGAGRPATGRPQGGTLVDIQASVSGRRGRHVVFTVWQASHSDQSYYWCSDVAFPK